MRAAEALRSFRSDIWRRARSFATAQPLHDTYHYLLERPEERHLDLCSQDLPHDTPSFSKRVYENSRRKRFFSRKAAYRDWLTVGRTLGLEFNEGMNTCLKVILKIKDETYLLPIWMNYYSKLVGWHNIIVMDCGSTDEIFLNALAAYQDKVLIFSYPHYYDYVHNVGLNREFYEFVASNCRYLCVVDADEFVFGYSDGTIGRDNVLKILSRDGDPVYPGTWYPNISIPVERSEGDAWQGKLRFGISEHTIITGTVNGKSIVRSDVCVAVGNIGHNLHVADVVTQIRPASCGKIGVLHVSNLGPKHVRARILKHLKARGMVPNDMPQEAVEAFLKEAMARGTIEDAGPHYVRQFLRAADEIVETGPTFDTDLIEGAGIEANADFQRHVEAFDFAAMLPP